MTNHIIRLLLFILLIILAAASSANARPRADADGHHDDTEASVTERCRKNAQNRHSYYWTVQHPDQPNVTHHLYGFLALKSQVYWDNLSPLQKAHFEAANVSVFESDASGLAELRECVREAAERATPLSATLAERLDAYFDASTDHELPLVGREWRALSAGWLLVGLLQVLVNQGVASLPEGRASQSEAWHGSLLRQAQRMHKRVQYVERMPERCNSLPSAADQPMLEIGIEHLMDELEALKHASEDARGAPVKSIIALYKCGVYGPVDAMIRMQFLSSVSAERKDNLTLLNNLLMHDLMSMRNRRWMSRIGPMLQYNPQGLSYFIALNSMHFLAEKDSLVELLRARGFRVRELRPDELLGNTHSIAEKLSSNFAEEVTQPREAKQFKVAQL